jgi:hypothetical protein
MTKESYKGRTSPMLPSSCISRVLLCVIEFTLPAILCRLIYFLFRSCNNVEIDVPIVVYFKYVNLN